jgi:putative hemolysin
METEIGLAAFAALFILDLVIAATRVSLLNARPLRLLSIRDKNPNLVDKALALIEHPRLRAAVRLSQTLVRFSLAGLSLLLLGDWFITNRFVHLIQIGGLLLVALLMLVCEFAVEANALRRAEEWTLKLYTFGTFLVFVFTPLVFIPMLLLRSDDGAHTISPQVTEDELKNWVEAEEEAGSLEREERQMIYSIFQFGDTLVREIMVPRVDILALDAETPLPKVVQALIRSGHSRVPIYEDTIDNIIGLLYAKDLLRLMNGDQQDFSLRDFSRPAHFVPETKKADELLAEMQSKRVHLAIVVDEYGGVAGLVTLEDIVEEIIGEIQDEYDPAEELPYQATGPDEYMFQGWISLDDFNQVMDSHLPKIEADTLAGFLYEQLGRVPQGGETIRVDGLLLTIEQVSGRRIRRVRASRVIDTEGEPIDSHVE